jgi:hypothetical protein
MQKALYFRVFQTSQPERPREDFPKESAQFSKSLFSRSQGFLQAEILITGEDKNQSEPSTPKSKRPKINSISQKRLCRTRKSPASRSFLHYKEPEANQIRTSSWRYPCNWFRLKEPTHSLIKACCKQQTFLRKRMKAKRLASLQRVVSSD